MITFSRLGHLGRFGNQLFQYAGTRLYAEQHGFEYAFPDWDGRRLFAGMSNDKFLMANVRALLLPTIQLADIQATSWSERLLRPWGLWQRSSLKALYERPKDNVNLYGYLQDDFAIAKLREHADKVRGWFRFKPEMDTALRNITDQYRPWLAAHVRRWDMIKRKAAMDADDVLAHVRKLIGQHYLFVASDDASVSKTFSEFRPFTVNYAALAVPPWAVDFWILNKADILVGSGSTFAWWAAFLGQPSEYWAPPLNRTWTKGTVPPIARQRI